MESNGRMDHVRHYGVSWPIGLQDTGKSREEENIWIAARCNLHISIFYCS